MLLCSLDEVGGDFFGIFVARIVFGDDDNVGMLSEDGATNLARRRVATTGATVNGDDFALVIFDGIKNFFESIGGMSVIYDDGERLTFVDEIHTTFDAV